MTLVADSPSPLTKVKGLHFERRFTTPGVHPYDELAWEKRDAIIGNEKGKAVFEQQDVEFPTSWSQLATNVVTSKYFRGHIGKPGREWSLKQLIDRVTNTIAAWSETQGYFASDQDRETFQMELISLLVNQKMAFNSPVWFNVGIQDKPQCSACFINSVSDDMGSIMDLAKTEAMLFKGGSGAGVNLSPLRGAGEKLRIGGSASGPVSFMKGLDAFAGVVKSGGTTRRAAKMVILDVSHPDIMEFIDSKMNEEKKAWTLIDGGYDGSFTGEAYGSVYFQNANHSVRVTDDFMHAYETGHSWEVTGVADSAVNKKYRAKDIFRKMAEAAHLCGDPGIQYDDEINRWHTSSGTDRIYASNPCSEYMFLNDTACNLASLNLMKFVADNGTFNAEDFQYACKVTITAQEILVGNASYPTPKIEENSHNFRPLGIGYANLGALLMSRGYAYDSDEGRDLAASITSLMTAESYRQSAEIARDHGGPFKAYPENRDSMIKVIKQHRDASFDIINGDFDFDTAAVWNDALGIGLKYGFRNAQASVLAPTGTIAFMMDCDTTGVEPDIALVKYKKLVGEGYLKIVNQTVPKALRQLGYGTKDAKSILQYIEEHETIEGAPGLKDKHLSVFDCAFKPQNGERSIEPMGHIRMMAAVQPFISGAISKTVNMPEAATVEDIEEIYHQGWLLGLKAIAVYRDGSKRSQPLSTTKLSGNSVSSDEYDNLVKKVAGLQASLDAKRKNVRRKLPNDRTALTHKFNIGGHDGYLTVGLYEDGTPGELFLRMSKEGSTLSGLMDAFATVVSISMQYGVPLEDLVSKFSHMRFEPQGFTGNQEIPIAKSIVDYVFRWLGARFLGPEASVAMGNQPISPMQVDLELENVVKSIPLQGGFLGMPDMSIDSPLIQPMASNGNGHSDVNPLELARVTFVNSEDAPACVSCGSMTVRNASCFKCLNCGESSGCS